MSVKKRISLHCKAVKQVSKFFLYIVKEVSSECKGIFLYTHLFQISVKNVKQCKAQYKYKYKYKFIAHFYTLPSGQTGKIASLGAGTNVPTPANFFYVEVFGIWIENAGIEVEYRKLLQKDYIELQKNCLKSLKILENCVKLCKTVEQTCDRFHLPKPQFKFPHFRTLILIFFAFLLEPGPFFIRPNQFSFRQFYLFYHPETFTYTLLLATFQNKQNHSKNRGKFTCSWIRLCRPGFLMGLVL